MEAVAHGSMSRRSAMAPVFWLKFAVGVSISLFAVLAAKKAVQSLRGDEEDDQNGNKSTPRRSGALNSTTRDQKRDPYLSIVSWSEVYEILSALESRQELPSGLTVRGLVTNTFAANSPSEDASSQVIYDSVDGQTRYMFGIFDGHSAGFASNFCQQELFGFIERRLHMLDRAKQRYLQTIHDSTQKAQFERVYNEKRSLLVETALTTAFLDADKHFVAEAILSHLIRGESLEKCVSGSCVIVAFIENSTLYVANVGDCRAVMGSMTPEGTIVARDLSVDQNTDNRNEVKRIQRLHPEDPNVVANARVKSILRPTRNIGGALLKEEIVKEFVANNCLSEPWKPPYTTAAPELTICSLAEEDRFIVLASDGLWDLLSSQEVVNLIHEYEEARTAGRPVKPDFQGDVATYIMSIALTRVPLVLATAEALASPHPELDKLKYILKLPESYKRSVYDDITITVIFLDPTSGKSQVTASLKNYKSTKPAYPGILERVDRLRSNFGRKDDPAPSYADYPASVRLAISTVSRKTDLIEAYVTKCWQLNESSWTKQNLSTLDLFHKLGICSPSAVAAAATPVAE